MVVESEQIPTGLVSNYPVCVFDLSSCTWWRTQLVMEMFVPLRKFTSCCTHQYRRPLYMKYNKKAGVALELPSIEL
jgi:hypothetical protein